MLKYIALIVVTLFCTTTAHAEWQLFPALYSVTGVASDDVLNVRAGTGATHPIIKTLAYNDRDIEIVSLSDDGRWGLIGYPGGSGWASMRYLSRQAGQDGSDLPRPLICGGNEPFWALNFGPDSNEFNEPGGMPHVLSSVWESTPEGMPPVGYGVKLVGSGGEINAVITRSQCSDGMSEKAYGFEINALLSGLPQNRMLTGCCSLERR